MVSEQNTQLNIPMPKEKLKISKQENQIDIPTPKEKVSHKDNGTPIQKVKITKQTEASNKKTKN